MIERSQRVPQDLLYVDSCGLMWTLVGAVSRALRGGDCADLTETHHTSWTGHPAGTDPAQAVRTAHRFSVPAERAGDIDAEAVAQSVVDQYAGRTYPGVVVGSRHGSAAHLAAAMLVPWLPVGFETSVQWPQGCPPDAMAAMAHGMAVGLQILGRNDGVLVRQVHDPVGQGAVAGSKVTFHVRWQWLPEAYRSFLENQLERGGFAILLRDGRGWPVLECGGRYSFQLGSPSSGLDFDEYLDGPDLREAVARAGSGAGCRIPPGVLGRDCGEFGVEPGIDLDLRRWARGRAGRVYSVLYSRPEVLSAVVADLHRDWLRCSGKTGNRLVVETGRLIDPKQVVRTGMVPYWCEIATRSAVTEAELWLASSTPFTSVEVFPAPPGNAWSRVATREHWSAVAAFATRRGVVEPAMIRAYPLRTLAPRHATDALRAHPYDLPEPARLTADAAVAGLRANGSTDCLLLSFAAGD